MFLDEHLIKSTRPLVRNKARRLCRRRGFTSSDQDCIESQLWKHLVEQADKFDPDRDWRTFASFILDKKCTSIWRHRFAAKRTPDREECSLNDPVRDADGRIVDRHQVIEESTHDPRQRIELSLDLQNRMAVMSELQRLIVVAVARDEAISEIARDLGISPRAVRRCLDEIRQIFEDGDLRDYL